MMERYMLKALGSKAVHDNGSIHSLQVFIPVTDKKSITQVKLLPEFGGADFDYQVRNDSDRVGVFLFVMPDDEEVVVQFDSYTVQTRVLRLLGGCWLTTHQGGSRVWA